MNPDNDVDHIVIGNSCWIEVLIIRCFLLSIGRSYYDLDDVGVEI